MEDNKIYSHQTEQQLLFCNSYTLFISMDDFACSHHFKNMFEIKKML